MRTPIMLAAAVSFATPALAGTPFTDQVAWEAAAGSFVADDLSSYGVVALNIGNNTGFNGYDINLSGIDAGTTGINAATNLTFTVGGDLTELTFEFDQDITAFGATWLNSFVSNGLTIDAGGMTYDLESFLPAANFEFFGFTDSAFSSVTIRATAPIAATEFAAISDIFFAQIPAPATSGILALAGIAATRRRR